VAAIGGNAAARLAEQCDRMGFDGTVWPVHPRRETVAGRRVYRTVAELPDAPDAAFVGVNRRATVDVVAELSAMGAGGAVCYASGFLETEDGAGLQRELVEAAAGMPVIGPNCYGLINFLDGAPLWPDQHGGRRLDPSARGVAIVSQSSNIAISMTMQRRGLPIAYVVTAGNQAQLGVSAIAAALLLDERVSAIGLYVEGFDSVAGYQALATMARERRVPVVVMKAGRSERGRAAALSHTASVAGSDAGARAFLDRLGFGRVDGVPELLETLKLLHVHGALEGYRLGALCCSGGEAAVLADAAEAAQATFPQLPAPHAREVAATVHPLVDVANPLDYHTFSWGDRAALTETFATFARASFDATLLVVDLPRPDRCDDADWQVTLDAFSEAVAMARSKGLVAATLGENLPEACAEALIASGIAPLAGVREALAAVDAAAAIGSRWRRPPPEPVPEPECAAGEPVTLDEVKSKALLGAFGVPAPPGGVADDEDAAVAIAESLGGSVALKALGLAHKTEKRAVRLPLDAPDQVRKAARDLLAMGDGVLVERCFSGTVVELIVGVSRDPEVGLLLTIGSGGTLVGLLGDTMTLLLPVTEAEVRTAVTNLRLAPLFAGYRGGEPADLDAAVAAILAIARFADAHRDRLEELDVNPLGVAQRGGGVQALDALVSIRGNEV